MSTQDRKAREFERRGQEILDAALSLFESDDWEAITVDQIANKADVAKGTIYKHFSSKYEIYARLAIQFQGQMVQHNAAIDENLPVLDRFKLHLKAGWEMHLSSKELHRVFLYCNRPEFRGHLEADTLSDMQDVEMQLGRTTFQLIQDGIDEGLFPNKPIQVLAFSAQSAFWGAVQMLWSGYLGDVDQADYLEEIANFMLAGLIHIDHPVPRMSEPG